MTIEEVLTVYLPQKHYTSKGDNLTKIIDALYDSRDSKYYFVIVRLNPQFYDWWPNAGFDAGVEINYFPKEVCDQIYEVNG